MKEGVFRITRKGLNGAVGWLTSLKSKLGLEPKGRVLVGFLPQVSVKR